MIPDEWLQASWRLAASSVTRRRFSRTIVGALTGVAFRPSPVRARAASSEVFSPIGRGDATLALQPAPDRIIELLRHDDLLVLQIEFYNLDLFGPEGALPERFTRLDQDAPAFIVLRFPPQHLAEPAYGLQELTEDPLAPPPIPARISGRSTLAFRLPETVAYIPYALESLLDWSVWEPVLSPLALPPGATAEDLEEPGPPGPPGAPETAIELPYRLMLSPHAGLAWRHAPEVVTREGRTELWHTRLGVRASPAAPANTEPDQLAVRAIRAKEPPSPTPFITLPTTEDRAQIVRLTTDFGIDASYIPTPIQVNQLMLSALGGWLDARGAWDLSDDLRAQQGLSLEAWQQISAMGRDQFVRIVRAGFIYPFGHRASWVTETERTFEGDPEGNDTFGAYLRKREYVVIVQEELALTPDHYQHAGREMPLHASVRILTPRTPLLDTTALPPAAIPAAGGKAFWMRVGGRDFQFRLRGQDPEAGGVEFGAALIFVSIDANALQLDRVAAAYRDNDRRRAHAPGQRMAFARRVPDRTGDAILTTTNLYFDTVAPLVPDGSSRPFVPVLDKADIQIPAVEHLLNRSQPTTIRLHGPYLEQGLDGPGNQAMVFAALEQALPLAFPPSQVGGLAAPNMDIAGLSQHLGPVGGRLAELDAGTFDPATFFRSDATLLGGVRLDALVDAIFTDDQFPKVVVTRTPEQGSPDVVTTTLTWRPRVRQPQVPGIEVIAGETTIELAARIEQRAGAPDQPSTLVTGKLERFAVNFLDIVRVRFASVSFRSVSGAKPDFSAVLEGENPVEFLGDLAFLNELRKFIPSDGFSDPPALEVTPTGVEVGYTLALPPAEVGIFALKNVSLSSRLSLPFTGEPSRLRFAFARRDAPFQLTVSMFGGGGFFGLALGLDRVELIEASLEFGGSVSLNLGVASGGVYVMAGVYFQLAQDQSELTGYVRCGGSLEILGLISVSLEFYLSLGYAGGKAHGVARLTVEIEIAFFSKSVSLTVERSFGGSGGDPTFGDLVDQADWEAYGAAFAA